MIGDGSKQLKITSNIGLRYQQVLQAQMSRKWTCLCRGGPTLTCHWQESWVSQLPLTVLAKCSSRKPHNGVRAAHVHGAERSDHCDPQTATVSGQATIDPVNSDSYFGFTQLLIGSLLCTCSVPYFCEPRNLTEGNVLKILEGMRELLEKIT